MLYILLIISSIGDANDTKKGVIYEIDADYNTI
jgi:hypothetical protein